MGGHQKKLYHGDNDTDGLVQDCSNAIANALELLQSYTKPSKQTPTGGNVGPIPAGLSSESFFGSSCGQPYTNLASLTLLQGFSQARPKQ